jgi:hypothetical protein
LLEEPIREGLKRLHKEISKSAGRMGELVNESSVLSGRLVIHQALLGKMVRSYRSSPQSETFGKHAIIFIGVDKTDLIRFD